METLKTTETHLIAESEAAAHRLCIEMPRTRLDNVVLKPAALKNLLAFMDNSETVREARQTLRVDDTIDYGRSTLILMHGPAGTGKTMTARAMANRTGRPLVTFLPGSGRRNDTGFENRLDAFLTLLESKHAIGLIDECHGFLGEDDDELPVFLTEIEKHDVTLFLTTTTPEVLGPALDRRISFKFATTTPDAEQRRRIWENLLPESVFLNADVDLNALAGMFNINGGYIKNAILYALNLAILRNPDHVELAMSDLVKAGRIQEKSTGSGMRIRTVLDPDLRPADICHDSLERAAAETIALRLCRTTVDNANILVCCRDLARADTVALAIAGCSGGTISRIDTNMVLDGDMMYRRYDMATVLRQALGAAYESGQVMIVTGLSSHLPQTGEYHDLPRSTAGRDHPGSSRPENPGARHSRQVSPSVSELCSGMPGTRTSQPGKPPGTVAADAGRCRLAGSAEPLWMNWQRSRSTSPPCEWC